MNIDNKDLTNKELLQAIYSRLPIMGERQSLLYRGSKTFFNDYIEHWLNGKKLEIAITTYEKYESYYRANVKPAFTGLKLTEVTVELLQVFVNNLVQKGLHAETIKGIVSSILRPALREAVGRKLIADNPTLYLKCPKVQKTEKKAASDIEIRKLRLASKSHRLWIAVPLLFANTTLRRAELLGLSWKDVDLANGVIHVNESYVSSPQGHLIVKDPKTPSSTRRILINGDLVGLLRFYREHEGKDKTYVISQEKQDKRVSPTNFSRLWRQWCKKAGVNINIHCARHTCCTLLHEGGADAVTIAKQSGHADIRTLGRYLHQRNDTLQRHAVDKAGALLRVPLMLSNAIFDVSSAEVNNV